MRLVNMAAPDKSRLGLLRLLDVAALAYLIFSAPKLSRLSAHPVLQPIIACGRHSLEVFAFSCLLALFARLGFRTFGTGWQMEICVNGIGLSAMMVLALFIDRNTMKAPAQAAKRPLDGHRAGQVPGSERTSFQMHSAGAAPGGAAPRGTSFMTNRRVTPLQL
jgi:hypothetical protein